MVKCVVRRKIGVARPNEAARNLFSMLRALDKSDVDVVLAEAVPEKGLGRAVNDRLRRAAAR